MLDLHRRRDRRFGGGAQHVHPEGYGHEGYGRERGVASCRFVAFHAVAEGSVASAAVRSG